MAEGGNSFKSIVDGSDIVHEFVCTPCSGEGSRKEALHFCQSCDQFLCNTCTKYHRRYTQRHQLQQAGSAKRTKKQAATTKQQVAPKCYIHPDRDVEMHCGTHDMVYCCLCIAKDHRSCNNVKEVQDGVHKPKRSALQLLVSDIDRATNELRKIKQNKSDSLKQIKTKKDDLLKKIDKTRNEINDHLDVLERKIKSELDAEIMKLEQEIKVDIDTANDLLTTASDRRADHAIHSGDKHMFIAEKLGRKVVSDVNAFVTNVASSDLDNIEFKQNQRLYDDIEIADSIGKIVRTPAIQQHVKRRQYVVKSSYLSNVRVCSDIETCAIVGMCQLQDGSMLLVDYANSKLKRLDDQLIVKDFCGIKSEPFGLCAVSSSEVIIRYSSSLQFINVGQKLSPRKTVNVNTLDVCIGNSITFCSDKIWTLGDNCIYVYSSSGSFRKMIETDSFGQRIFSSHKPSNIAVNKDGNKVYVTTYDDDMFVFNHNGKLISKFHHQRLSESRGLCMSDDDIVFAAGSLSKNVFMFDSCGSCIGELVPRKDMVVYPKSLCFDNRKCRLIVGYYSNKIQIFDLSE